MFLKAFAIAEKQKIPRRAVCKLVSAGLYCTCAPAYDVFRGGCQLCYIPRFPELIVREAKPTLTLIKIASEDGMFL